MYFHLSDVLVKDGDLIRAGQVIGQSRGPPAEPLARICTGA